VAFCEATGRGETSADAMVRPHRWIAAICSALQSSGLLGEEFRVVG